MSNEHALDTLRKLGVDGFRAVAMKDHVYIQQTDKHVLKNTRKPTAYNLISIAEFGGYDWPHEDQR